MFRANFLYFNHNKFIDNYDLLSCQSWVVFAFLPTFGMFLWLPMNSKSTFRPSVRTREQGRASWEQFDVPNDQLQSLMTD